MIAIRKYYFRALLKFTFDNQILAKFENGLKVAATTLTLVVYVFIMEFIYGLWRESLSLIQPIGNARSLIIG